MTPFGYRLKGGLLRPPYRLKDRLANRGLAPTQRILVSRFAGRSPNFYNYYFNWLKEKHPDARRHFELGLLPRIPRHPGRYSLVFTALQDPVKSWSIGVFDQQQRLEDWARKYGIPVVNPVARLERSEKKASAALIESAGIRVPKMIPLQTADDVFRAAEQIGFPFFVRERLGHRGAMDLVESQEELSRIDLKNYSCPLAVEFVDTQTRDGIYRKYRVVVAGRYVIPRHVMNGRHWIIKNDAVQVVDRRLRRHEVDYLEARDPYYDQWLAAARNLGFDLVAFDYGYDRQNRIVCFEANPFPCMHFPDTEEFEYRRPYNETVLSAVTLSLLERAAIDAPESLVDRIGPQHRHGGQSVMTPLRAA